MQQKSQPTPDVDTALEPGKAASSHKWARELLRRLAAMLLGVLMALLVVEIVFRLLQTNEEQKVTYKHDRPKYYYLPERSKFREPLHIPQKSPNTYRVLVLGDSFTEPGENQYDDAFPQRLNRMLNLNEHQRTVEVFNLGRPGFSTVQEFELAKKMVASYQPDLFILQITLNDPELTPYRVAHKGESQAANNWLLQHWKSYNFIRQRLENSRKSDEFTQYYFDLFDKPDSWGAFSHAIHNFSELAQKTQVPVFAAIFPLFSYTLDGRYPFHNIHQKIRDLLKAVAIPHTDLFFAYRGMPSERLEVRPGVDGHPNEIAHRIAADHIYRKLEDLKLIPDDVIIKRYEKRKSPHVRSLPSRREPQK